MRNTLKFPDMVASCTYHKTHRSIARFDNHSPVISYILPFLKSERPKASRLIASSLGHFLFYRPVRTVTGLIARSLFILPSCQNRHRTHLDEGKLLFSFILYSQPPYFTISKVIKFL